jgi:hypothetical protein
VVAPRGGYLVLLGSGAVTSGLVVVALRHVLAVAQHLHEAGRLGREASAHAQTQGTQPLTTFRRTGAPGDPLNLRVTATSSQLGAALASAGWYRADEITIVTSMRISVDSVLARKYTSAPVSNLYLYGRKEDYAYERPGTSVRERDHVRFWDTGERADDGRPTWIGGATRDIKVELSHATHLPTHGIAADVDWERDLVAEELTAAGWVTEEDWAPGFGQPTRQINGDGFPYYTDGRIAVLSLANVPVLPIFTHVRGPLLGGLAKRLAPLWHAMLPSRALSRMDTALKRRRAQQEPVTQAESPSATSNEAVPQT